MQRRIVHHPQVAPSNPSGAHSPVRREDLRERGATMSKYIKLFIACILFYNCSYVINGKLHHVHVQDTTGFSNSIHVTNRNGELCYKGTIPVHLSLSKKSGYMKREKYHIIFLADDMQPLSMDSICFIRSKSYCANLYFFNYPGFLVIDPCTGTIWISPD